MLTDKLSVSGQHAAEVLRPGPVHSAIDHYAPDLLVPHLLGFWREAQVGIDLPLAQELNRFGSRMRDEVDVLAGVQTNIRHHAGKKDVPAGIQCWHGNGLALQIADGANFVRPK